MPRIKVEERDLSWYFRQRGEGIATVFLPGLATFGPTDRPVLCDSTNFANVFGTGAPEVAGDISYNMAASIIKAGFNVLYYRIYPGESPAYAQKPIISNTLTLKAKYPGTFGNKMSIDVNAYSGDKDVNLVLSVKVDSNLVETLSLSLFDMTSSQYYQLVNSDYLDLKSLLSDDATLDTVKSNLPSKGSTYALTGGRDLDEGATSEDALNAAATSITNNFLSELADPYQYGFDIVLSGGLTRYKDQSGTTKDPVDEALCSLAEKRGTAIYLVDGSSEWSPTSLQTYAGLFDTSYAAVFGPWSYAQFLNKGTLALVPGSYVMVITWAQSCSVGNPLWMAPAGVKRASLGSFFKETKYLVGKSILDSWQDHDYVKPDSYQLNPIAKIKQYGYVIYGNSTLLHTKYDGSTSMLQSFSTRVLANLIKSQAFSISLSLQFDQLSSDLFTQFKSLLGVYMDQLKYQDALYDYEIVLESGELTLMDLNEKRLPIVIRISPSPAVENIDITLEITQSGVNFNDETDETEVG